MAPNGNTRWPHTALLTRSTSGPERQYRWPPKAQILNQVHDGSWRTLWQQRDTAQQAYYAAHPERFRSQPTTPAPADTVGINRPEKTSTEILLERLHAA